MRSEIERRGFKQGKSLLVFLSLAAAAGLGLVTQAGSVQDAAGLQNAFRKVASKAFPAVA